MNDPVELILTPGERQSALWLKLLRHFEFKRDECRAKNDGPLNETETAGMRARIGVYKSLVDLDNDRPDIE
jgi:hypothetical protein